MKRLMLFFCAALGCGPMRGETVEEAYARLTAYRSVWDTNAWAYVQTVPVVTNVAIAEANGRWFADFLQYPDVTATNRMDEILRAKKYAIGHYGYAIGIFDNTNAWYAVADYIAHLKDASDPRWIDESYDVVTDVMADGVKIVANTNPLLDFASYKQEHFSDYRQAHTNLVNETDALNSFFMEWSNMTDSIIRRERMIQWAMHEPKRAIRECFWWFGSCRLLDAERASVQSNIIERAQLSLEEADSIFTEKFQFVPIK